MKLSAVLPCYNKGSLVGEAVRSLQESTRVPEEILIINDGSTDKETLQTLEQLAQLAGVEVITAPNAGVAAARNTGISRAKGEYVLLLDHDDMVTPSYLAAACEYLAAHTEVALVYPSTFFIGDRLGIRLATPWNPAALRRGNYIPCAGVVRADAARKVPFPSQYPVLEDWAWLLQFAARGFVAAPLPDEFFIYRIVAQNSRDAALGAQRRKQVAEQILTDMQITVTPRDHLVVGVGSLASRLLGPLLRWRERQNQQGLLRQRPELSTYLD